MTHIGYFFFTAGMCATTLVFTAHALAGPAGGLLALFCVITAVLAMAHYVRED